MSNSTIPLIAMGGIIAIFMFFMISTTYPSATGTIANSTKTVGATACSNCDSGVKTFGQQLPFILMAVTVIVIITIVIAIMRNR